MKKIVLFTLFIIFCYMAKAQNKNNDLPENKYKSGYLLSDFISKSKGSMRKHFFSIGYQRVQFLNPQYGILLKENILKQKFGLSFGFRYTFYPAIFDVNGFYTTFKNINSTDGHPFAYKGVEGSVSSAILPLLYKTSNILVPYVGIGYQCASLYKSADTSYTKVLFSKNDDILSLINLNQPIWKTGLMINAIPKIFILNFEYKQSLMLNKNEKALNQFCISLNYRIEH